MLFGCCSLDHIFFSRTRVFMALMMGAVMAVIMLSRSCWRCSSVRFRIVRAMPCEPACPLDQRFLVRGSRGAGGHTLAMSKVMLYRWAGTSEQLIQTAKTSSLACQTALHRSRRMELCRFVKDAAWVPPCNQSGVRGDLHQRCWSLPAQYFDLVPIRS